MNTILIILLAQVVFWFKGNAKFTHGLDWNPFQWWLYTSLFTSYACLYTWWDLVEAEGVYKAQAVFITCSLCINLVLNTYYFGFETKGVISLCLCTLALFISK